jgi:hypothetical protein
MSRGRFILSRSAQPPTFRDKVEAKPSSAAVGTPLKQVRRAISASYLKEAEFGSLNGGVLPSRHPPCAMCCRITRIFIERRPVFLTHHRHVRPH